MEILEKESLSPSYKLPPMSEEQARFLVDDLKDLFERGVIEYPRTLLEFRQLAEICHLFAFRIQAICKMERTRTLSDISEGTIRILQERELTGAHKHCKHCVSHSRIISVINLPGKLVGSIFNRLKRHKN